MKVKPVGNRVIGKKLDQGEITTQSGIIMPDSNLGEELVLYTIEAVSRLVSDSKAFQVGQHIFIPRASPTARMKTENNEDLDLFSTEYIVAVVT